MDSKQKNDIRFPHTHLMHVGVHQNLEGPHSQGNVRGRSGDGQHVVVGLLAHIVGVDCLH